MDLSYSNTCTTIYSRRKTLLGKLAYGTLKSATEAHFSEKKKEKKIQNNLIFLDKKNPNSLNFLAIVQLSSCGIYRAPISASDTNSRSNMQSQPMKSQHVSDWLTVKMILYGDALQLCGGVRASDINEDAVLTLSDKKRKLEGVLVFKFRLHDQQQCRRV